MAKKLLKKAFTLVELIIVIAIVAILAVISFLWLNKWLGNARDASRKGNLANIDKALQIYLTENTTLPKPDNNTMLYASGIEYVIGYQGYFGETARDSVGNIDKAPKDGNNYFTYYVNSDLNKYQLMAYMENPVAYNPSTANAENYAQRYIYVRGDKLGILTDSEKNPLQDFGGTGFNVLSGENNYTAYFDNSTNASGTGKQLFTYYYNQTKSLLQNTGFAQYDDNLVFYSDMEDLDGTSLKDLSQYGNNGTILGSSVIGGVNTPTGKGTDFNTTGGIQVAPFSKFKDNNLTIAVLFKSHIINKTPKSNTYYRLKDYYYSIVSQWDCTPVPPSTTSNCSVHGNSWWLGSHDMVFENGYGGVLSDDNGNIYNPTITGIGETSSVQRTTDSPVTDEKWHWVMLVKKDNTPIIYIDGVKKTSKAPLTGNIMESDLPFYIGTAGHTLNENSSIGIIDEVRIYNRSLSDEEIKVIYNTAN